MSGCLIMRKPTDLLHPAVQDDVDVKRVVVTQITSGASLVGLRNRL